MFNDLIIRNGVLFSYVNIVLTKVNETQSGTNISNFVTIVFVVNKFWNGIEMEVISMDIKAA